MVQLVGILNITPDSFSDGGDFFEPRKAIEQAKKLFKDGATIVDIGAESTRPNAIALTSDDEWQRLEPVLKALLPIYPNKISLDSYHPETIVKAFQIGPVIVNDVTGLNNPRMLEAVTNLGATIIISHLPGYDVQAAHQLANVSSVAVVRDELLAKVKLLMQRGFDRKQIILDPGIGFGKTMELNWELLAFGEQVPDYDVMIGYSRKRFLGKNRMELAPNLDAGRIAIEHGAAYLRVHDVAGHTPLLKV